LAAQKTAKWIKGKRYVKEKAPQVMYCKAKTGISERGEPKKLSKAILPPLTH